MSGYAVGHVLRTSRFNGTALLVLIVIAEATHQDGRGAWPAVGSIAQLARTTERNVRRVLRQLEKSGELVTEHGKGPYGTSMYSIPMAQLRLADRETDNVSGGHARRKGRTTGARGADTAMSAKPSSIRKEPSSRARARGAAGSYEPQRVTTLVRETARSMRMPA